MTYRVKQVEDRFKIQRKVLGIWFSIMKPSYFHSLGSAQSYINTVLKVK